MVFFHSIHRLLALVHLTIWVLGESDAKEINGQCSIGDECCNSLGQKITDCKDGKCCPCQIERSCLKKHGSCVIKGKDCNGTLEAKGCTGKYCSCCVPHCPETPSCLSAGGRCDLKCQADEEPHRSIECLKENNKACLCCVPKSKLCLNTAFCKSAGGHCDNTCDKWLKQDRSLCDGDACTCCFHDCPCENNKACGAAKGHCAPRCQIDEKANPSIPCLGDNCVCCVPEEKEECQESDKCLDIGGRCDERCNEKEVVDTRAPCNGESCVCCVPKSDCVCTSECAAVNGRCDSSCHQHETVAKQNCDGFNCVCCIPDPPKSGCEHNGKFYQDGDSIPGLCVTITCIDGKWEMKNLWINSKCGMCNLHNDPHITTFDSFYYNWHGKCNYSISQHEFGYQEKYGIYGQFRQCNGLASCIDVTTFTDNPNTVIEITYNGAQNVLVNNVPYVVSSSFEMINVGGLSHPVFAMRFKDCNFFFGSQGLMLLTCKNQVFVWAYPDLKDQLNGLCGHYNMEQADDFTDRDGAVLPLTSYPNSFPLSWTTADQSEKYCKDKEDPNTGRDPCEADRDEIKKLTEMCQKLFQDVKGKAARPSTTKPNSDILSCVSDLCLMNQHEAPADAIKEWMAEMRKMLDMKIAIEGITTEDLSSPNNKEGSI